MVVDDLTKGKLKAAAGFKMMLLWRKVYNNLCGGCQAKLFEAVRKSKQAGLKQGEDIVGKVMENFCENCKEMIKRLVPKKRSTGPDW